MIDVLVIGAGQAGLALAQQLRERGREPVLVDGAPTVGAAWANRWDSLELFTPAEYCSLPGLHFPAAPGAYPGKDAAADYLHSYAEHHRLDVRVATPVSRLQRNSDSFVATTVCGELAARQVVIATGPFQEPFVPDITTGFDPTLPQVHSKDYRNPGTLRGDGPALVVGAGNSGLQIAEELAHHRPVHLAAGTAPLTIPRTLLGRSIFWWLDRAGVIWWDRESLFGRRLRARKAVNIGTSTRRASVSTAAE